MTTSILEQSRQFHEDIESVEKIASRLLSEKAKKTPKYRPLYDHAVLGALLKAQDASRRLLDLYADSGGLRKGEISVLGGRKRFNPDGKENETTTVGPEDGDRTVWLNFYDQLKNVKDYHKINSVGTNSLSETLAADNMLKDVAAQAMEALEHIDPNQIFTVEENYGRRLDMSTLYLMYTNLIKLRKFRESEYKQSELSRLKKKLHTKKVNGVELNHKMDELSQEIQFQEIDYITFLKIFDDFVSVPRHCKYKDAEYDNYLTELLNYLQGFLKRLNPLSNHVRMIDHLKNEFNDLWDKEAIPAWELKTHLMPLYSFPTDHLFATQGTFKSHKEGKKYQKALSLSSVLSKDDIQLRNDKSEDYDKKIATKEFLIQKLKLILGPVIQRTIEHLQKKQSRTLRELELEGDDSDADENKGAIILLKPKKEEVLVSDEDSDDEKPIYNPLNLPLGWDGKPIPFWLYRLHGLGVEYKCEICGNYSYWGKRAFDRHFQEWRHAFGMRCLKIPNTVHFKEITKIEDAVILYEKLKKEAELQASKADQDIECEDAQGNIMSARAYEDLRRQGLL